LPVGQSESPSHGVPPPTGAAVHPQIDMANAERKRVERSMCVDILLPPKVAAAERAEGRVRN